MSYLATTSQTTGRLHRNSGRLAIGMPVGIKSEHRSPSRRNRGRHGPEYPIGVAIDGDHIAFAQVAGGKIVYQPLMPFTLTSFQMVVDACNANHRRAITAENLAKDFGHSSSRGLALMQALSDSLGAALGSSNPKIRMLFEEWETLYGQAADLSIQQKTNISSSLRFTFAGPTASPLPAKLFVAHTFHSLLMKLIAAEIVAAHGLASSKSLVHELLALSSDDDLIDSLASDIEDGGFFNAVGLNGFVEEAIFSWYIDAARASNSFSTAICGAIRTVLAQLSVYRFDSIQRSGKSRDVIRDFYQDLVPEELRKSLGEFYTPDWLVEYTVDKLGVADLDWLDKRVLDPTCGSGAFLLEVIGRKRRAAELAGLDAKQTILKITTQVWGFDLNPLAVQSSRVNFLMAIADLLTQCKGMQIEIPVLLADAVYSPAPDPKGDEKITKYSIGSQHANLEIELPSELVFNRILLDRMFVIMGDEVEDNHEYEEVEKKLIASKILTKKNTTEWRKPLKYTYDQVLELHRKNWNGIWFRIVRNFFWSATAGKFDLVAGNPPWVRWSNLPEAYRKRAQPTCRQYKIFSDNGFHGGNELDISAMITYTTADKWLRHGGKLAFVITQTVFQSPSSQGFRTFQINDTDRIIPLSVDDLKGLKPFPDAANKTSVALFEKRSGGEASYPVPYTLWQGQPKVGSSGKARTSKKGKPTLEKSIQPTLSKADVLGRITMLPMEANPISSEINGAPWVILPPGRFATLKHLCGESGHVSGRKGITTDLNGVYFVEIHDTNSADGLVKIQSRPDEGKTDIGRPREFWVEPSLLYPLIKGASDFEACYLAPKEVLYALVPNKGILRADYEDAAVEVATLPRTEIYFKAYKKYLEKRSTYKGRMPNAPYYCIYNIGTYSLAPYKVMWPEMSSEFCAAVASETNVPLVGYRPYVPDHKVFFVEFQEVEPAYFLCGLLNSGAVKELIEAHNISTQMGNVLKHINLPEYNPHNKQHRLLVESVGNAHSESSPTMRKPIVDAAIAIADKIIAETIKKRSKPPK